MRKAVARGVTRLAVLVLVAFALTVPVPHTAATTSGMTLRDAPVMAMDHATVPALGDCCAQPGHAQGCVACLLAVAAPPAPLPGFLPSRTRHHPGAWAPPRAHPPGVPQGPPRSV